MYIYLFNKMQTSLDAFLESLVIKMDKQVFSLSQILHLLQKNEVDIEAKGDD